jgi:hypothetical protein
MKDIKNIKNFLINRVHLKVTGGISGREDIRKGLVNVVEKLYAQV